MSFSEIYKIVNDLENTVRSRESNPSYGYDDSSWTCLRLHDALSTYVRRMGYESPELRRTAYPDFAKEVLAAVKYVRAEKLSRIIPIIDQLSIRDKDWEEEFRSLLDRLPGGRWFLPTDGTDCSPEAFEARDKLKKRFFTFKFEVILPSWLKGGYITNIKDMARESGAFGYNTNTLFFEDETDAMMAKIKYSGQVFSSQ